MNKTGKLYICSTPIGNLEDVTLRVLRILSEVDLIAAEDTRTTQKLLNKYKIKKPLTSYHKFNESAKKDFLTDKLKSGQNIALVSEAGMPGLNDPGQRLIQACIRLQIPIEVLPGPTASITALVLSGLSTSSFTYLGFLPRQQKARLKTLAEVTSEKRTLIFYESPHRIIKALQDMIDVLGDRQIVLARELTKKFEEVKRGKISHILKQVQKIKPKGEIVLVVEGAVTKRSKASKESLAGEVNKRVKTGLSKQEAIKEVALKEGLAKRVVYQSTLD